MVSGSTVEHRLLKLHSSLKLVTQVVKVKHIEAFIDKGIEYKKQNVVTA